MDNDSERLWLRGRIDSPRTHEWTKEAACLNHPYITTDQFFLDPPTRPSRAPKKTNLLYEQARQVCLDECPVRAECLGDAMNTERGHAGSSRYGIYGGLDPFQRANIERDRLPNEQ